MNEKTSDHHVMDKNDHTYDLRPVPLEYVRTLCEQFHGYGSAGNASVYCFGVWEGNALVAAYAWQPPPPGAARAVCPEAPQGVLALSRMVAHPSDAPLHSRYYRM